MKVQVILPGHSAEGLVLTPLRYWPSWTMIASKHGADHDYGDVVELDARGLGLKASIHGVLQETPTLLLYGKHVRWIEPTEPPPAPEIKLPPGYPCARCRKIGLVSWIFRLGEPLAEMVYCRHCGEMEPYSEPATAAEPDPFDEDAGNVDPFDD